MITFLLITALVISLALNVVIIMLVRNILKKNSIYEEWILEFKRALKTADAVNDIDFSSLNNQYFGFAIFENAQIAHSIKPNLVLKFKK